MKTKVHRIVLLVVDTDRVGEEGVIDVIENQKYPNYCINPRVMDIDTVEVDWSDEHPLNQRNGLTKRREFERLFDRERLPVRLRIEE